MARVEWCGRRDAFLPLSLRRSAKGSTAPVPSEAKRSPTAALAETGAELHRSAFVLALGDARRELDLHRVPRRGGYGTHVDSRRFHG
jgi:hypothetical protein